MPLKYGYVYPLLKAASEFGFDPDVLLEKAASEDHGLCMVPPAGTSVWVMDIRTISSHEPLDAALSLEKSRYVAGRRALFPQRPNSTIVALALSTSDIRRVLLQHSIEKDLFLAAYWAPDPTNYDDYWTISRPLQIPRHLPITGGRSATSKHPKPQSIATTTNSATPASSEYFARFVIYPGTTPPRPNRGVDYPAPISLSTDPHSIHIVGFKLAQYLDSNACSTQLDTWIPRNNSVLLKEVPGEPIGPREPPDRIEGRDPYGLPPEASEGLTALCHIAKLIWSDGKWRTAEITRANTDRARRQSVELLREAASKSPNVLPMTKREYSAAAALISPPWADTRSSTTDTPSFTDAPAPRLQRLISYSRRLPQTRGRFKGAFPPPELVIDELQWPDSEGNPGLTENMAKAAYLLLLPSPSFLPAGFRRDNASYSD